jgi:hypothetical protein
VIENPEGKVCPQCGRDQPGRRNFCPYCGHSFRTEPAQAPPSVPSLTQPHAIAERPPSRSTEVPARRTHPVAARRFRIADRRVLFGILGMLDIPVIIILLAILWGPRFFQQAPPSICEHLDLTDFSPERYERGIGGELTKDTFFDTDVEYVIQDTLVVPQGRRLLIQPGARLVFEEGAALEVHGGLYACGTERKPVTFTSEEGQPGSWPGIQFHNAEDDSTLSHVLIQFAGDRALYLERSTPVLVDVKIDNSSGFPISTDGNILPDLRAGIDLDGNPFNGVEIRSGTLSEESVDWPNQGFVYVVSGPLEVSADTTLAIEPEVVVKFWRAPGSDPPGMLVRGLLKADGVQFTSVYDSRDEVGGATYREALDPSPGDWAGIGFYESSSKSYLHRCVVQYAGQQGGRSVTGAISMIASSPELTDITIADSGWYPLSADADSFPILNNVRLVDNDPGDAFEIRGGSAVTGRQERTWSPLGGEDQIVRVIRGEVAVEAEATLMIEPGVVIKFEEDGRLVIRGTLQAIGGDEESERIVFTSLRDGDYGGETDKATSPQDSRSWGGIAFEKTDESSVLQNCIVRYAPISINDATPRLIDNLIVDVESAAIWASPGASPELRGNRLEDNEVNGVAIWKAELKADQRWPRIEDGDGQVIRVLAGEVTVANGATLSIEPGTIIKASSDGKLKVYGGLWVFGEADLPVVFTSLSDDQTGGDTNRKLQEASAGDWLGIEIGAEAHTYFAHTSIRYAQNALSLRGGNAPVIDGWLRVTDGQNAVWCDGDSAMPSTFLSERNESNEIQCPTQ